MAQFKLSEATIRMLLDGDMEIYEILMDRESRIRPGEDVLIQEMYDSVARRHRLHPDDGFEEIIEIMMENIAEEHG